MNQAELIIAILAAPSDRYAAILSAAKGNARRRPILPRAAAEILGVHRRTLQRYERAGQLHAIRVSPHKIRYDAVEVERLAERGVEAVTGVEGAVEAREPLPAWAVALVEGMTAGTWKAVKAELLGA